MSDDKRYKEAMLTAELGTWEQIVEYFHNETRTLIYPPTLIDAITVLSEREFEFDAVDFFKKCGWVANLPRREQLEKLNRLNKHTLA